MPHQPGTPGPGAVRRMARGPTPGAVRRANRLNDPSRRVDYRVPPMASAGIARARQQNQARAAGRGLTPGGFPAQ